MEKTFLLALSGLSNARWKTDNSQIKDVLLADRSTGKKQPLWTMTDVVHQEPLAKSEFGNREKIVPVSLFGIFLPGGVLT